ncbi:hypothetical protein [Paenibacillus apis]|uniref:Uncharacterized protein n=1 Tax=Paenibacillus apis TaxID=1792174 RepID=A0A919Y6G8_9BACL|nr:hypothetical protein [Paenibacillus apis]GIO43160.1 hypothetical protein J41TS4_29180 [Paenibacillus apis]
MKNIQPSEQAMNNLYKSLGRVLPKYLSEIKNKGDLNEQVNKNTAKDKDSYAH